MSDQRTNQLVTPGKGNQPLDTLINLRTDRTFRNQPSNAADDCTDIRNIEGLSDDHILHEKIS